MLDEEALLVEFGKRIRRVRDLKSISQEALAHQAELDRSYVSGVERGVRNISLKNIYRLAEALGVSPTEFFVDQKGRT